MCLIRRYYWEKIETSILFILDKFCEVVSDKKSRENVFCFMVYSSLIKQGDLHAKNIGLIEIGEKKWALVPLYDIISTYVYEGKIVMILELLLSMKILKKEN